MIGVDIGSLNTVVSRGEVNDQRFKCEVVLSDISSRTMPSIISFTDHHRLIGDQAVLKLKKYNKSSFTCLNRLIGLCPNSPFAKLEIGTFYLIGSDYDPQKNVFSFKFNEKEMVTWSDTIITAYINKIKSYYIIEQKKQCESITFSCPDYFTAMQKDALLRACKACDFDKVHIINGSTAITLYYGYNKYKDLFRNESIDQGGKCLVDPNIIKYVLFIDAGNSKTTFVLSQFNYSVFKVVNVLTLPFFGGRNLDEKIFNIVAQKFKSMHNIDITKNIKAKMRVLEVVTKARKILTVNKDSSISIESLVDDFDFSYLLSRAEYEDLIKEDLHQFREAFVEFYKESMKKIDAGISCIEMAGELMRTPCLQKIVKDVTQRDISKGILTDECISIGSSIYGAILQNELPLPNFQGIYHFNTYSIYLTINNNKVEKNYLIKRGDPIPSIYTFELTTKMLKGSSTISFQFYSDPNEVGEIIGSYYNNLLIEYEIYTHALMKLNQLNGASAYIDFLVNNNGKAMINLFKKKDTNGKDFVQLNVSKEVVSIKTTGLYNREVDEKDLVLKLKKAEIEQMKIDDEYREFCRKKNSLAGEYYKLKNALNENDKLNMIDQTGRPIIQRLYSIEKHLETPDEVLMQSNSLDITEQKIKDVSRIVSGVDQNVYMNNPNVKTKQGTIKGMTQSTTPFNTKDDLMSKIGICQKKVNDELTLILQGQKNPSNKNALEYIMNLLNGFKFKASQCKTEQEILQLTNHFNQEMDKYHLC